MGHHVQGLIVRQCDAERVCQLSPHFKPIPLPQDFVLITWLWEKLDDTGLSDPKLWENLIDPAPSDGRIEKFAFLYASFFKKLLMLSESGPIMYFETDYWGGAGKQGAVVCEGGEVVLGPVFASTPEFGPINQALARMGVKAQAGRDEFDTIELGKYRDNEDWIEQPVYGPPKPADLSRVIPNKILLCLVILYFVLFALLFWWLHKL